MSDDASRVENSGKGSKLTLRLSMIAFFLASSAVLSTGRLPEERERLLEGELSTAAA